MRSSPIRSAGGAVEQPATGPAERIALGRTSVLLGLLVVAAWLLIQTMPARAAEEPIPHDHGASQTTQKTLRAGDASKRAEEGFDWGLPETHDHGTADAHGTHDDHAAGEEPATADDHPAGDDPGATGMDHGDPGTDHGTQTGAGAEHGESHGAFVEPEAKPAWRWWVVGAFAALNVIVLLTAALVGRLGGGAARRERSRIARTAALSTGRASGVRS